MHAHGQEKRISVSVVVVQFKIHSAGILNRPVGNLGMPVLTATVFNDQTKRPIA